MHRGMEVRTAARTYPLMPTLITAMVAGSDGALEKRRRRGDSDGRRKKTE